MQGTRARALINDDSHFCQSLFFVFGFCVVCWCVGFVLLCLTNLLSVCVFACVLCEYLLVWISRPREFDGYFPGERNV